MFLFFRKSRVCRTCKKRKPLKEFREVKYKKTDRMYRFVTCNKCCYARNREAYKRGGFSEKKKAKAIKKIGEIKNEFSEAAKIHKENIVKYPDAPGGEAFIGFAKKPLMKSKTGHGYQGVLLQSTNRELVQCHECGKWMKQIALLHTKKHNLTTREYKIKHGLFLTTGLISDVKKIKASEHGKKALNHFRANRTTRHLAKEKRNDNYYPMEKHNRQGTCPVQLKQRLVDFIHRFRRLPTQHTKSFDWGIYQKNFGSVNKALAHYGLPMRTQQGSQQNFVFPGGEKFILRTRRPESYEQLYDLMVKKCPVLSNKS